MPRMIVECVDPNDFEMLQATAEQIAGKCNVTYFLNAEAMVEAGTAKSLHDASHIIAEQTGESERTVEDRIYRGKKEVPQLGEKSAPSLTPQEHTESGGNQSREPEIKADRKHLATGKKKGGKREGSGRKPQSEKGGSKSKAVQRRAWQTIDRRLQSLVTYMTSKCEMPAEIVSDVKSSILNSVDTITLMLND